MKKYPYPPKKLSKQELRRKKFFQEQREYEEKLAQQTFNDIGLPPMGEQARANIDEALTNFMKGEDDDTNNAQFHSGG